MARASSILIVSFFASTILGTASAWAQGSQTSVALDVRRSIELAMQNNVNVRLAKARTEEARGKALQSASDLLPKLMGTLSQSRVFRENLAALGFSSGPFPILIGPFNVFDARVQLVQNIFDWSAWRRFSSSESGLKAAKWEEDLAREQVAAAAALAYVDALRARKAIEAAQAGVRLAKSLLTLAVERHDAGTATGIDVARARTREAEERLRELNARIAALEAEIRLKHVAGLPLGQAIGFQDSLGFSTAAAPGEKDAIDFAMRNRLELLIAKERLAADIQLWKAAKGERLPALAAMGDVGLSGNNPDSGARATGSVGVRLNVPLFQGGLTRGRIAQTAGSKGESEARLEDIQVQVEEDVRLSLQNLVAAAEKVQTSDQAVSLAESELQLARDMFSAGVGDNVELVDAQTVLARNQDAQVAALAQYNAACVNLATALGRMRDFVF